MYILQITFKSIKNNSNLKNTFIKVKNKNKIITVLKSPHVNKKSREQFIYKNYIRKINIKFKSFLRLLDSMIIFRKRFTGNLMLTFKIIQT